LIFSCEIAVGAGTTVYSATAADFEVAEVCSVIIPTSSDASYYQLDVFDYSSAIPDAGSMASRFITSASFGATRGDISAFQSTFSNDPAAWISAQMDKPPTLHREFFRRRANKRFPAKITKDGLEYDNLKTLVTASQGHIHAAASPLIACTPGSRWTRFAFTESDIGQAFVATPVSDRTYANSTFFVNIAHGSDCCSSNNAEVGRSAAANPGAWIAGVWQANGASLDTMASTALAPEQCEAECAAKDDCNFFTHDPTRRMCVYCSRCDLQAKTARGQREDFTSWQKTTNLSAVPFGKLNVSIDNHLRTFVENSQSDPFILRNEVPHPFKICSVEEKVGGKITYGADCSGFVTNPAITFDQGDSPTDSVVLRTRHLIDLRPAIDGVKIQGEGSSTLSCSTAPKSGPQFAVHEPSGSTYMFDRRVALAGNTVGAPSAKRPTALRYECPNVPKTFVNAHTCRTGVESCSPVSYTPKMFTLDEAIIRQYYTNASRHVHAITGLTLDNGAESSPCKTGSSRWCSRSGGAAACDDRLDVASRRVIAAAVRAGSRETIEVRNSDATASNDIVRDITIHEQCNAEAGAQVVVDGVCWEHTHRHELNVYDFTAWARAHDDAEATEALKEGSGTVAAVAEVGSVRFLWNGSMPLWAATVKDRRMQVHFLGRLGGSVDFVALPAQVQDESIARIVGAERRGGDASVEICGSPGEVANDPLLANTLQLVLATSDTNFEETFDSRAPQSPIDAMVWQNVVFHAEDQLRQRMAWALSQIFVINETPLYRKKSGNEHFFTFYDIFVRHAFGSYRDVLREVSYSPMMGYMLTFVESKSRKRTKTAPDENYAREVMQLFSMGLYRLHDNGTRMTNANGEPILSYDIDDVASLAAGWTGFERQKNRANYEDSILMTQTSSAGARHINVIDPMKIVGRNRDANPKRTPLVGATRAYIGDGSPLCVDLPRRAFLKKGAKYRYLGRDPNPAKQSEPRDYGEGTVVNRTTLRTDSELFRKLCAARSGPCQFKSEVVLLENLQCGGLECNVDTVRVVKMSNAGVREDGTHYNVYYEYLRQACVVQSYFAEPTVITGLMALRDSRDYGYDVGSRYLGKYERPMCADPRTHAAGTACCPTAPDGTRQKVRNSVRKAGEAWTASGGAWERTQISWVDSTDVAVCQTKYTNEHVSYATANETCSALGQRLCNFELLDADPGCETLMSYFWRPSQCNLLAQITTDGHVSVVDDIPGLGATISSAHPLDSEINFRVVWANDQFPTPETNCGGGACTVRGSTCLCTTRLSDEAVFAALPSTQTEVQQRCTVGAPNPAAFEAGTYIVGGANSEVTVHFLQSQPGFTTDAIFKLANDTRFFKNVLSTVHIGNASNDFFSFRNPVAFLSKDEETTRDAEHETDAIIDYYFDHPNVPPHVALNLIQRFVTSNPSPRYVEAVAVAFKTGLYSSFGSGTRGDLTATIAAVLLDREARSPLMHQDPSFGRIREPMIKLFHLMRGFDFNTSLRVINMNLKKLGQAPFKAPTVFGYYQYDYTPPGAVEAASLVAPEASLLNSENILNFLNGAMSMIRWGLTPCDDGLQTEWFDNIAKAVCTNLDVYRNGAGKWRNRYKGWLPWDSYIEDHSTGVLTYSPTNVSASAETIVKELDTVLTGGRCDPHVLGVITDVYSAKLAETASAAEALQVAQQLLIVTPEFHTTAPNQLSNETRNATTSSTTASAAPRSYKAILYLWMSGGLDSYNMLVPFDGCKEGKDLYGEYSAIRGNLALEKAFLLPITARQSRRSRRTAKNEQVCDRFGLHFGMEAIQRMYNAGDALFIANAGMLTEPITKDEYIKKQKRVPMPLFAHNTQMRYAQTMDGLNAERNNGVLGRILDVMDANGTSTASYMVAGSASFALNPVSSPSFDLIDRRGDVTVPSKNSDELLSSIDNLTSAASTSPLAELWAGQLRRSLNRSVVLNDYLEKTTLTETGWVDSYGTGLAAQLQTTAKLIKANTEFVHNEREVFMLQIGGFDTHRATGETLSEKWSDIDSALAIFEREMKAQGLWDNIVIVQASEFGRALKSNGDGADHGWGGNYFLAGGQVRGGQVLGKFPDDLSIHGPQITHNGRLLPTTSWDQIWNGLASWYGVGAKDMDEVLPVLKNFPTDTHLRKSELFEVEEDPVDVPSVPAATTTAPAPGDFPTEAPAEAPSTSTSCDEAAWPDKDRGLVCGECKVLVDHFSSKYRSCNGTCLRLFRTHAYPTICSCLQVTVRQSIERASARGKSLVIRAQ
jgi:cullin-associated NEDD8-dissociated protein 1